MTIIHSSIPEVQPCSLLQGTQVQARIARTLRSDRPAVFSEAQCALVLNAPSAICRYLDDNSCSALIILGFVMMSPLVIVAAAVFCGLLRRFRILLFIQPIRRAWYRGKLVDWAGSIHARPAD